VRARALYGDNVRTTEATSGLWGGLYEAEETAIRLLLLPDGPPRATLEGELEDDTAPAIEQGIVTLRQANAGDPPAELGRVERLAATWADFKRLWRSGGALDPGSGRARQPTEERVGTAIEPATGLAAEMAAVEAEEARESQAQAETTYAAARTRILLLSAGAALVRLAVALTLIRDLVPRLRSYSGFAGRVADGQLGERL
jgi:hypothetical protein